MSRIRSIKPNFFTSENIVALTPLARLYYVALWCEADREGRLNWKPNTFKMRYLPGDACDIMALSKELINQKLIILYTVGDQQYAEIPTFKEHQVINNREADSTLPPRVKAAPARVKLASVKPDLGADFESFYAAYPKKMAKPAALRAFANARITDLGAVLNDIAIKAASEEWTKEGGKFIPRPATYLNQRRWEDAGVESAPSGGVLAGAI